MDRPKKNFRTGVLTSGLVTPAELDQTIVALWTERSGGRTTTQVEIAEKELAERLIELGRLTPYQAKQLLAGLTKLKLGQYRILEPIGHGGMGEVFKAEHEFMGRIVAIKVLPISKATPSATASFIHEIRSQARLQHVNLVQAYDAGRDGNVYYLVTEYVNATDLRKYVRQNGPLGMKAAATIITQAAKGLQHAHEQGLIHRDVKPGNLLVTPEGITKVSDLGLSAWLNETEADPLCREKLSERPIIYLPSRFSPRDRSRRLPTFIRSAARCITPSPARCRSPAAAPVTKHAGIWKTCRYIHDA